MFWSLCNMNGPFSRGSWHTDKRAMDTVKQSPINNAFASDCLAPRMGLLKNRGHMFFSSGQPSLDATHTPTQCSAPWTVKQHTCATDASGTIKLHLIPKIFIYIRSTSMWLFICTPKYWWGYLFMPYIDTHACRPTQRECVPYVSVCLCDGWR